jgi:ElaB/YqjD/DUF883 family membrane-anchored ribosome-binding protein
VKITPVRITQLSKEFMMNNSSKTTQAASKMRSAVEESKTKVTDAYHQMEHVVEDRPLSAVALSFGVGLGVGIAIGAMIAASTTPAHPHQRAAERMGQQLLDALARVVPSSLSDRFS